MEVVIVGAGPAGARAAELLALAGADVLTLDPKAPWEKPCGGGLTESAFHDMPELAELEPEMRPVQRVRLEVSPDQGFGIVLDHPIRIVSRRRLASWQLDRARAAGAAHSGERVLAIEREADRWRIETDHRTLTAHLLVGADGAASRVRRTVAPGLDVELAPTRVAYAPGSGPTPHDMLLRFYPGVTGYVWDFPRPDHRSVGVVMQAGGWRRSHMDREIDAFRRSEESCRCTEAGTERVGAVIGTAQLGHGDFTVLGGAHFALLGDAAGLADPATGEGIRNALCSAALLAEAWRRDGSFGDYASLVRRAFAVEFMVSRAFRRIVFDTELGARLVDAARRSDAAQAFVAALVGAINEHDGVVRSFLGRWGRSWRQVHRDPSIAWREPRGPRPCGANCGEATPADGAGSSGDDARSESGRAA